MYHNTTFKCLYTNYVSLKLIVLLGIQMQYHKSILIQRFLGSRLNPGWPFFFKFCDSCHFMVSTCKYPFVSSERIRVELLALLGCIFNWSTTVTCSLAYRNKQHLGRSLLFKVTTEYYIGFVLHLKNVFILCAFLQLWQPVCYCRVPVSFFQFILCNLWGMVVKVLELSGSLFNST